MCFVNEVMVITLEEGIDMCNGNWWLLYGYSCCICVCKDISSTLINSCAKRLLFLYKWCHSWCTSALGKQRMQLNIDLLTKVLKLMPTTKFLLVERVEKSRMLKVGDRFWLLEYRWLVMITITEWVVHLLQKLTIHHWTVLCQLAQQYNNHQFNWLFLVCKY